MRKRPFSANLFLWFVKHDLFSLSIYRLGERDVGRERSVWTRQNEAFWRAHQEAWKRSDFESTAVLLDGGHPAQGIR
jgi:hypothetical protein